MTTSPNPPQHSGNAHSRVLNRARLTVIAALVTLLAVCLASLWVTRGAMAHLPFLLQNGKANSPGGNAAVLVDLRPWQTAQALAPLAVTQEEYEYARAAERLADHEVDQAFATALRQANLAAEHRTFAGKALVLAQKVQQLQQLVVQDQAAVQRLTDSATSQGAKGDQSRKPVAHSNELAIAKAQLGLDSDELADAQRNLDRVSGDHREEIQGELAAHEQSMRKYDSEVSQGGEIAVIAVARQGTLAGRLRGWFSQKNRYQLLQQALQGAEDDIRALTAQYNALEAKANAETGTATSQTSTLASLKDRSVEREILSIYDDRIETEQQLATVYQKWSAQVLLQHRILFHLILQSLSLILFILVCMVLGDALVRHLTATSVLGRRQMHTLRSILELGIQLVGILLILLVVFGWPRQMPTILGLVTAGITIVLQDFILAFFGWFVLMGKNGIHVGDRVEINGITGEVAEIRLMNTTLLETGNPADMGLLTGRRISFNNSFAIRGQYFNFSTDGQWMWDEVSVSLPSSADPRMMIKRAQEIATEETREGAAIALREWEHSRHRAHLAGLNTDPVVSLKPTSMGFDLHVRYVTRASAKSEVRLALYRRVSDLLLEPKNTPPQSA